ncbi:MAG: Cof-type HAD-IIB family hydrolase [Candidatus Nanopelagicales bacterium]
MEQADVTPVSFPVVPDIRMIACDMDGTLLDADHEVDPEFWPLISALTARGIVFCPASGRQYYNLLERFSDIAGEVIFIAENGTLVMEDGHELSSTTIEHDVVDELIEVTRALTREGADIGAVVCGKDSAYVERADEPFSAEVYQYYHRLEIVPDLTLVVDDILKLAVYDFDSAAAIESAFAHFRPDHQVVVSGAHWLDVMAASANKGAAVRQVQERLGISREHTMVFGDYLNDLELMDDADYSFAMANAHPDLQARARYLAPANTANGVVRTIKSVLQIP